MENGGVLVLDSQGSLVGGFAPPWAVDNVGKKIPTHYDIRDNFVVQVIEHLDSNVSYPVVADPYLGRDLISSAVWSPFKPSVGGRTLHVSPTGWARAHAATFNWIAGNLGWQELVRKYPSVRNRNPAGMKDQYICHAVAVITARKDYWNLDNWRPYVGLTQTILKGCNP